MKSTLQNAVSNAPRQYSLGSGEVIHECQDSHLVSIVTDHDLTASGDLGTGRQLYAEDGTELRIVKIDQLTDVFSIIHMIPSAVLDTRRN